MFDGSRRVAILREVELGPQREKMIRSVTWAAESKDRSLIGYFPHLRMAAGVTWGEWRRAAERADG